MSRNLYKILVAGLAAAALVVPAAHAGNAPQLKQGFSLGVPLQYMSHGTASANAHYVNPMVPVEALTGGTTNADAHYVNPMVPVDALTGGSTGAGAGYGFHLGVPVQ